jgi:hypothetical protein
LHPVSKNGKWGYIDRRGIVQIPFQFSQAHPFSEGLARVRVESLQDGGYIVKYGYVEESGALRIPATFDDAGAFSEGIACVTRNGKTGYIDKSGSFTVEPRFDAMHPEWSAFPRGWLVRIRKALEGRPAGYIDKTGSWIIPPRYKSISSFPFTVWRLLLKRASLVRVISITPATESQSVARFGCLRSRRKEDLVHRGKFDGSNISGTQGASSPVAGRLRAGSSRSLRIYEQSGSGGSVGAIRPDAMSAPERLRSGFKFWLLCLKSLSEALDREKNGFRGGSQPGKIRLGPDPVDLLRHEDPSSRS